MEYKRTGAVGAAAQLEKQRKEREIQEKLKIMREKVKPKLTKELGDQVAQVFEKCLKYWEENGYFHISSWLHNIENIPEFLVDKAESMLEHMGRVNWDIEERLCKEVAIKILVKAEKDGVQRASFVLGLCGGEMYKHLRESKSHEAKAFRYSQPTTQQESSKGQEIFEDRSASHEGDREKKDAPSVASPAQSERFEKKEDRKEAQKPKKVIRIKRELLEVKRELLEGEQERIQEIIDTLPSFLGQPADIDQSILQFIESDRSATQQNQAVKELVGCFSKIGVLFIQNGDHLSRTLGRGEEILAQCGIDYLKYTAEKNDRVAAFYLARLYANRLRKIFHSDERLALYYLDLAAKNGLQAAREALNENNQGGEKWFKEPSASAQVVVLPAQPAQVPPSAFSSPVPLAAVSSPLASSASAPPPLIPAASNLSRVGGDPVIRERKVPEQIPTSVPEVKERRGWKSWVKNFFKRTPAQPQLEVRRSLVQDEPSEGKAAGRQQQSESTWARFKALFSSAPARPQPQSQQPAAVPLVPLRNRVLVSPSQEEVRRPASGFSFRRWASNFVSYFSRSNSTEVQRQPRPSAAAGSGYRQLDDSKRRDKHRPARRQNR